MDESALAIVLWGIAALLLGWTWLPALISGLGGTRYTNGGTDDPEALAPSAIEPDYAFWHRQIIALGYEPLGPAWMRITFNGPHWRYETAVRVFYSRNERGYVFIQKQPKPLSVWWLTIFATCWQDGGLLLTSNQVDEAPSEGDYVVQGMESIDLAAVQELHRAQRDRMIPGKRPDPDGRLETLLKATRENAGAEARRVGVHLGQSYLATHLLIHAFLSAPIVYLYGFGYWAVPFVNIVLGSMLAMSEYLARRRAGAIMRETLLAQVQGTEAASRP